jgi:cytidylate kinase
MGQRLCQQFDFHMVDSFIVDELARKSKLSKNWLNSMEKEASSTLLSFISDLVSTGGFYRTPAAARSEKDERQKYIDFLTHIFTAMAYEGGYVIVGRAAQFILKGHPKAIHVLLVAEYESRVAFLIERYGISRAEAENMILERERERAALASRLFEGDIEDLALYHLVLNTSLIPFEWSVEIVARMVSLYIDRETKGASENGNGK